MTLLLDLPSETHLQYLGYLSEDDCMNVRLTCRRLRDLGGTILRIRPTRTFERIYLASRDEIIPDSKQLLDSSAFVLDTKLLVYDARLWQDDERQREILNTSYDYRALQSLKRMPIEKVVILDDFADNHPWYEKKVERGMEKRELSSRLSCWGNDVEYHPDDQFKVRPYQSYFDGRGLSTLFRAMCEQGLEIKELSFGSRLSTVPLLMFDTIKPEHMQAMFRHVTVLEVTCDSSRSLQLKTLKEDAQSLKTALKCADEIDTLRIDPNAHSEAFRDIFLENHWPKLRVLEIRRVTLNAEEIIEFLQAHKDTLRQLFLSGVFLEKSDKNWNDVATLLGQDLNLEDASLVVHNVCEPSPRFHELRELERLVLRKAVVQG